MNIDTQHLLKYTSLVNDSTKTSLIEGIEENLSFIPIPHCLINHIIINNDITCSAKLLFLLIESLSFFNQHGQNERQVALTINTLSKMLGYSKPQVIAMQKQLEKLGFFIIKRDQNQYGQKKRNVIIPTIPDITFRSFTKEHNKNGNNVVFNKSELKISYLEKTKMFIPINYSLFKTLFANRFLSQSAKVLFIDVFIMWYKYHLSCGRNSNFTLYIDYNNLTARHHCSYRTLIRNVKLLEDTNLINRQNIFIQSEQQCNNRYDKPVWQLTLNLPNWYKNQLSQSRSVMFNNNSKTLLTDYGTNLLGQTTSSNKTHFIQNDTINEQKNISINLANSLNSQDKVIDNLIIHLQRLKNTLHSQNEKRFTTLIKRKRIMVSTIKSFIDKPLLKARTNSDHDRDKVLSYNNKDTIKYISNLGGKSQISTKTPPAKIKLRTLTKKSNSKHFSIIDTLIDNRLKTLPQTKIDKARKYAYALTSKKLATGYAATLNKHELAKQLILHISNWKPTRLGNINREQEIDAALSVAWRIIINGSWQAPFEYTQAEIMHYEFLHYKDKYKRFGVVSPELKVLELEVNKLWGISSGLTSQVKNEDKPAVHYQRFNPSEPRKIGAFNKMLLKYEKHKC